MNEFRNRPKESGDGETLHAMIKETLFWKADSLEVTSEATERTCSCVRQRIKEESGMRKWNVKKVVVVAAAICAIGSITAVAAGKVTNTVSYSSHKEEFTNYSELEDMQNQLGFKVKSPQQFANGYVFASGVPSHDEAMDEEGNVVKKGDNLTLNYSKDGMSDIFMSVQGTKLYDEETTPDQSFEYNGIILGYSTQEYLFVPPEYEASEEEKAKEAAGELYISYGSDQVEHTVTKGIMWEDEGVLYYMASFDNTMSPEDFYNMACEIIDMK